MIYQLADSLSPHAQPSGGGWVKELKQLDNTTIQHNDRNYRLRLQALQSVDEMVDNLFARLQKLGLLDNTYVFYSSDNGFHISQHRLMPGKTCGYEEDVNVPLIVRGPGVPRNVTSDAVSAHVDLAPTFMHLAGQKQRKEFDGSPIPLMLSSPAAAGDAQGDDAQGDVQGDAQGDATASPTAQPTARQEHANIEYWGIKGPPQQHLGHVNNTYKAVRLMGKGYSLYYSVWCEGDHEMYDMTTDPGQMHNLLPDGFSGKGSSGSGSSSPSPSSTMSTSLGVTDRKLATRLDSLVFVLKSCRGDSCREPWAALMPGQGVATLKDALQPRYDDFFEKEVPRVHYTRCEPGYIVAAEGPQFQGWTNPLLDGRGGGGGETSGADPEWALWA